jgi:hypothetical protein
MPGQAKDPKYAKRSIYRANAEEEEEEEYTRSLVQN